MLNFSIVVTDIVVLDIEAKYCSYRLKIEVRHDKWNIFENKEERRGRVEDL